MKFDSTVCKVSKPYAKVHNRAKNAFNIRLCGGMKYDFDHKKMYVEAGEMIFIPKGSTYSYKVSSESESVCLSINFEGDFFLTEPKCFSLKEFYGADSLNSHFADMWQFGSSADRYKCIALFYELLAYISALESSSYADKHKYDIIEPAIDYLKKHIYDPTLTADDLHKLCGISHSYFRQLFILRFSVSPKRYIVNKRLSYAKSLIDSGEADSIKELSQSVGYNDPLYFSKAFKKMYGASPINIK